MNLNTKTASLDTFWDLMKWLLVVLLLVGIVTLNYYMAGQSAAFRASINLIAGLVIATIASFTLKGKRFWLMMREVRIELRKVIWPSRQETFQATLVVVVVVALTALMLWGIDSILLWAVSFFTGQRG